MALSLENEEQGSAGVESAARLASQVCDQQRNDLLEALKLADAALSGANMNMQVVERKVRDAIAKAEGWALVPHEPTEAMLRAAFVAMNETPSGQWKRMKAEGATPRRLFDVKMAPRYRAMVAAAQSSLHSLSGRQDFRMTEKLVAVGLIRDGVTHGAERGFKEHWRLRGALGDADPYEKKPTDNYGFITSTGRFVTRHEAMQIGAKAGQCQIMRRELLSSDIDW